MTYGLQWLYDYSQTHPEYAYEGRQGTWRPDLLIPADEDDGFVLCEINGRFFSLGLDLATVIHRGLANEEALPSFLQIPDNTQDMIEGFFSMFSPDLPLHIVQATEFLAGSPKARFIQSFFRWVEERTGMRPRSVRAEDLRLLPDATSQTGYALCCVLDDGGLEKIQQVGLQFADFSNLSSEVARHLALCASNDVRTKLLVHDKRFLGILLQELEDLVKHGVLTDAQSSLIRRRIVPTVIPGSPGAKQLLKKYHEGKISKDEFIIKPAREGRGQGIKFGDELEISEWGQILEDAQVPGLNSDRMTYVIQPVVKQVEDDLFLDEEIGVQRCQRVGTYYSVNGGFVGFGAWRAIVASSRVCNMATGKAWKMGSVLSG